MKFTEQTKRTLTYRRFKRQAVKDGYEEVCEGGSPLWQFRRGGRTRERIIDSRVDPLGYGVWIKTDGGKQWADEHPQQAAMMASWALSPSGV